MAIVRLNKTQGKELPSLETGVYDEIEIVNATVKRNKKNTLDMLQVMFRVQGYRPWSEYFVYPDGEREDVDQMRMRSLCRLIYWFTGSIEEEEIDTDELKNTACIKPLKVVKKVETVDGREVTQFNVSLPPIPDEEFAD